LTRLRVQNALHLEDLLSGSQSAGVRDVLSEEAFRRMIVIERKRTERTNEPFLLMLLKCVDRQEPGKFTRALDNLLSALLSATRETDVIGWYRQHQAIGLLFTGLASDCNNTSLGTILNRVSAVLRDELAFEQFSGISISLHLFPDEWNHDDSGSPSNLVLYPDLHWTFLYGGSDSELASSAEMQTFNRLLCPSWRRYSRKAGPCCGSQSEQVQMPTLKRSSDDRDAQA
jgi:hypothetical protein